MTQANAKAKEKGLRWVHITNKPGHQFCSQYVLNPYFRPLKDVIETFIDPEFRRGVKARYVR